MDNKIGIAGWLYSQEILRDKSMTLLEMPKACAAHGVEVVELCSRFFESQETDYLNDVRRSLECSGLSVHNIAVDMGSIAGADAAVRRTDIEGLKQWFYTAAAIGSKAIRINTGHAGEADAAGAMQRVIEAYNELARVGEQAGVKLLMENHGGVSAHSENIAEILDGVSTDWFATCPDTGNFYGDDWEAGMRVMAPRAFSCHAKLFSLKADGWQTWTDREGQVRNCDFKQALAVLAEEGYEGPLCLEKEDSPDSGTKEEHIRDSLAYLRQMAGAA
jgi:sugar phosphate isomerase/epimerase